MRHRRVVYTWYWLAAWLDNELEAIKGPFRTEDEAIQAGYEDDNLLGEYGIVKTVTYGHEES